MPHIVALSILICTALMGKFAIKESWLLSLSYLEIWLQIWFSGIPPYIYWFSKSWLILLCRFLCTCRGLSRFPNSSLPVASFRWGSVILSHHIYLLWRYSVSSWSCRDLAEDFSTQVMQKSVNRSNIKDESLILVSSHFRKVLTI